MRCPTCVGSLSLVCFARGLPDPFVARPAAVVDAIPVVDAILIFVIPHAGDCFVTEALSVSSVREPVCQVKQIVGGTLKEDSESLVTNFEASQSAPQSVQTLSHVSWSLTSTDVNSTRIVTDIIRHSTHIYIYNYYVYLFYGA